MNDQNEDLTKIIRRLSQGIWLLSALVIVNILVSLFAALFPPAVAKRITTSFPDAVSPTPEMDATKYNNFSDWPLHEQIQEATVIAIARYEKDGERYKAVFKEFLKKENNTIFFYEVGDEYPQSSYQPKDGISYGDGQIIFFTGSPATMRYACSFRGDRIAAFSDMPFDVLRSIIK